METFREEIGEKKQMNSGKMLVDGVPDVEGEPMVREQNEWK